MPQWCLARPDEEDVYRVHHYSRYHTARVSSVPASPLGHQAVVASIDVFLLGEAALLYWFFVLQGDLLRRGLILCTGMRPERFVNGER